eukprot:scaffold55543_cov46-Prasinocladus_malaysianus.AAC.1
MPTIRVYDIPRVIGQPAKPASQPLSLIDLAFISKISIHDCKRYCSLLIFLSRLALLLSVSDAQQAFALLRGSNLCFALNMQLM